MTASTPLVYVLHSGRLFGTERMALLTLAALQSQYRPHVVAPPGEALEEARAQGMTTRAFRSRRDLVRVLAGLFRTHDEVAFCSTALTHSLVAWGLGKLLRTRLRHVHVVHGGTDERVSYGRKHWLNRLPVSFVAVSDYVRERLLAHGVRADRVTVIENAVADDVHAPVRAEQPEEVRRIAVVSRADPIKRLDLLFDMLAAVPETSAFQIDVYGSGSELPALQDRAARHPRLRFHGFVEDVPARLAASDLLLHTCPEEPFGLAILEAMRARVPVLVPDGGGAASIVEPGRTGERYRAADAQAMGEAVLALARRPREARQAMVARAAERRASRFAPARMGAAYGRLLGASVQSSETLTSAWVRA